MARILTGFTLKCESNNCYDASMNPDFSHISIVMVHTTHPGNIGAVARAMKNMGLSQLRLVAPREFPSEEAVARASGATDVLDSVVVFDTLEQAIADCSLVIGASARLRTIPWPAVSARECAVRVIEQPADARVAIVLGRERNGLTNEELQRCQLLVHIPTNPEYSSLNVAAAAQVLCYELRMAATEAESRKVPIQKREHPLATTEELEGLYAHLESVLVELAFLDPENPRQLMRRLRRLFGRAELDRNELNILRGILTATQKARRPLKEQASEA